MSLLRSGTIAASRNSQGNSEKKRLKALESIRAKCSSFSFPVVPKRRGYSILMGIGMHSSPIVADLHSGRAISYRTGRPVLFEKIKKAYCFVSDRSNQWQGQVKVGIRKENPLHVGARG